MTLLLKAVGLTLFLKITKLCVVCNNNYMMKMLKPCANVLDFIDYKQYTTSNLRLHTISGAILYTTQQV